VADERRPAQESNPEEALAVVSALQRVRDRAPSSEPTSAGCVVAGVALVALVLMPVIGRALDLAGSTMMWLGIGLFLVTVVGGVSGLLGDSSGRGTIAADVGEAIEQLVSLYPDGDEALRLEAAVLILDGAMVSTGPTFDRSEVARRLGDALPYVERIERILLRSDEIDPVFTADRLQ
jgi:hypothetical protein